MMQPIALNKYPFRTSPAWVPGAPKGPDGEFGRITVVLGANGSGKSRLLKSVANVPEIDLPTGLPVYVEGGRRITIGPTNADLIKPHLSSLPGKGRRTESAEARYRQQKLIAARLSTMMAVLSHEEKRNIEAHKLALFDWDEGGRTGPAPSRIDSKLNPLTAAFTSVFPHLTLLFTKEGEWTCKKYEYSYPLDEMSDGEKQVFCLLADIVFLSADAHMVIVDEPELNLHPTLAVRLWDEIEKAMPNAQFIYATHSLSFSMRPSVTDVLILDGSENCTIHLTQPFDWSSHDLECFLGSIPAVLTSRQLAIVEGIGQETFDRPFYQWIFGKSFTVQSGGNCYDVQKVVTGGASLWKKAGHMHLAGVIDRDFKTDEQIESIKSSGCNVLGYHEAESYLCHPKLLAASTRLTGKTERKEADFIEKLAEICSNMLIKTALNRTSSQHIRLSVGKPEKDHWPKQYEDAIQRVRDWANTESPRGENFADASVSRFKEEYKKCKDAIDTRDIDKMLALFPGKEALEGLARFAPFGDVPSMLNAITTNFKPSEFAHLAPLVMIGQPKG